MTNLSQLIGIPPAPTVSDLLSDLVSAEVSVSSATTLTSTAFGKMHLVSGSSDYTITLPAASGNSGKIIGLRITGSALFTIDGNGSEEIDGELTRVMWENESAILLCNGTGWTKIAGKSIPFRSIARKDDTQSFANASEVKMTFNIIEGNYSPLYDTSNHRFILPREGVYQININTALTINVSSRVLNNLYKNGTVYRNIATGHNSDPVVGSIAGGCGSLQIRGNIFDYYELFINQNSGASRDNFTFPYNQFDITEIPTW